MRHSLLLAAVTAGLLHPAQTTSAAPNLTNLVVRVIATHQEYDPFMPWQKMLPQTRYGYGVVVGPSLILTTESLVRNQVLVELSRAEQGSKTPAKVLMADCQANLALIAPDTKDPFPLSDAFPMADLVTNGCAVHVVQFDNTGMIQDGAAHILQIAVSRLPTAPDLTLAFTLLADVRVNGQGAAVLADNKLAGLIMTYDEESRTAQMLPYPVLRNFLKDALNPPYQGLAAAGFRWAPLIDPSKRRFLNVEKCDGGILVVSCIPGTGANETLKPDDVILEWDGFPVDRLGYYKDPDFGRLLLPYLIKGRRSPDEIVPVHIVRNGKDVNTQLRLDRWSDDWTLVPENTTNEQPEYLISGGLILRELDGPFLHAHGEEWQRRVDPRLAQLYLTGGRQAHCPGNRVIVLAGVLSDPINIDYEGFCNQVVTRVNGQDVRNMKDVFAVVDKNNDGLQSLTVRGVAVDLVLDSAGRDKTDARLARRYRIDQLRHQREPSHSP